ncbi:MAG: hypothetical protein K1X48_04990 [Burkholderiaceae bacterium]|nr:hypothetical protein [Burkholderiaceae bacterium]
MEKITKYVTEQIQHSSFALFLVIIIVIALFLILWRSGWLKSIKKMKLGPVEAERFESKPKKPSPEPKEETDKSIAADRINVSVRESEFKGDVGDIGGIIIKENKESRRK